MPCLFWGYWTIYNFFIYIYMCVCVCLPSLHSCGLWILLVYISCFAVICFVGASSSSILGLEKYFARACSLSILGLRKFVAHLWILLRHSSASALVSSSKTFIYSWSKIQTSYVFFKESYHLHLVGTMYIRSKTFVACFGQKEPHRFTSVRTIYIHSRNLTVFRWCGRRTSN